MKKLLLKFSILLISVSAFGQANWKVNGNSISGPDFLGTTNSAPLRFKTDNVGRMIITNTGRVGIGIASPTELLDVAGNAKVSGTLFANDITSHGSITFDALHVINQIRLGNTCFYNSSVSATTYNEIYSDNAFNPDLYIQSNDLFNNNTIINANTLENNTGKVGIGTMTPDQKLHVHNGCILVTGANPNGGPMIVLGGGTPADINGQWGMEYEPTAQGLNFWRPFPAPNFGNYFLFLANNGNVGIGTSTPANKLDVCGTIRSKEVIVDASWCDFVFEENYKLMTLSEREKFILSNKHLPYINSEKEVVANGASVGKSITGLLQNTEELTLYLIELNKKVEQLFTENKELKSQIETLSNK